MTAKYICTADQIVLHYYIEYIQTINTMMGGVLSKYLKAYYDA